MDDTVELTIPEALAGERADKAVAELLGLSRSRAAAVFETGVQLDGRRVEASHRVSAGQTLTCEIPDAVPDLTAEPVPFGVLYEDDQLVVVDKPAGLVVHPGSGARTGTLAAGLLDRYPELKGVGAADRWGLVHRLDKDTSGAILVARTPESYASLVGQLRAREIERTYTALVEGLLGTPTGTIDAPIGRDPARPTRRAVTHSGKHARTHYEVIEEFEESRASLLEIRLETGRTHQIRVHMSAIEHPVVGDLAYGATRKDLGSPRTFLHAARLSLTHPTTAQRLTIESPLPPELTEVLGGLT